MALQLHFGPGKNLLPEPWQNLGGDHDIRRPLRFENDSAEAIFCEHVIEHVPFVEGVRFIDECFRVLEPGGTLRLAFPDVARLLATPDLLRRYMWSNRALAYADALQRAKRFEFSHLPRPPRTRLAARLLITGWKHQSAWTAELAGAVLLVAGFGEVIERDYGTGALSGIDGHHQEVGREVAELETTVMEATK